MDLSFWRNLAIVLLVVEAFVLGLACSFVLYVMVRLLRLVYAQGHSRLASSRRTMERVERKVDFSTRILVKPFVWGVAAARGARAALRRMGRILHRR